MGEDSWYLVRNHLLKELAKWSDEYINVLGGIDKFEELKHFLFVDGLSMVCNFCYFFSLNKCNHNCNMQVTIDK